MTKARDLANIITGGFTADDIPNIPASKITSGTIDTSRISGLAASAISSGTFADARIPDLAASKITSGTFSDSRLPSTALNSNVDLTNLSASNMTSGTLPDARFPATLPAVSGANLTNLPASTGVTASSYSGSGYTRFTDGLIIQWGSSSSNSSVSFPLTFPNNCFSVVNMIYGTGFWDSENLQGGNFSTSGYSNKMQNKNRSVRYIAVGN